MYRERDLLGPHRESEAEVVVIHIIQEGGENTIIQAPVSQVEVEIGQTGRS